MRRHLLAALGLSAVLPLTACGTPSGSDTATDSTTASTAASGQGSTPEADPTRMMTPTWLSHSR